MERFFDVLRATATLHLGAVTLKFGRRSVGEPFCLRAVTFLGPLYSVGSLHLDAITFERRYISPLLHVGVFRFCQRYIWGALHLVNITSRRRDIAPRLDLDAITFQARYIWVLFRFCAVMGRRPRPRATNLESEFQIDLVPGETLESEFRIDLSLRPLEKELRS